MATKFTIVVPVFNSIKDLKRLITSLTPQLNEHELIIINDGSTDGNIISLLEQNAHVIPVHLKQNRGSSAARNAGIRKASGERIVFIDADCVATENWIEMHEQFHDRFPEDGCIGNILPQSLESVLLRFLDHGPSPIFGFNELKIDHLAPISYRFFYTANSSVPRKALLDAGLFDERYNGAWDDVELGYRLDTHDFRFRFNEKALVYHRNPDNYRRFFRRQIRVGRGYWQAHQHHPEFLGALSFNNQFIALKEGLGKAMSLGRSLSDRIGFVILEFIGRLLFWQGYLYDKWRF
jgi:glycosyltransferase involved in cell wall biosynthesis